MDKKSFLAHSHCIIILTNIKRLVLLYLDVSVRQRQNGGQDAAGWRAGERDFATRYSRLANWMNGTQRTQTRSRLLRSQETRERKYPASFKLLPRVAGCRGVYPPSPLPYRPPVRACAVPRRIGRGHARHACTHTDDIRHRASSRTPLVPYGGHSGHAAAAPRRTHCISWSRDQPPRWTVWTGRKRESRGPRCYEVRASGRGRAM